MVRGIHPPVLTDRGPAGAVRALAASSGLDVTVLVEGGLEEGPRPPAAVEAAAYFAVAEALTNAAKHSGGRHATVRLERLRNGLRAAVSAGAPTNMVVRACWASAAGSPRWTAT